MLHDGNGLPVLRHTPPRNSIPSKVYRCRLQRRSEGDGCSHELSSDRLYLKYSCKHHEMYIGMVSEEIGVDEGIGERMGFNF